MLKHHAYIVLVTPGISALEYHHRRAKLAKALPKNSIAVLAASDLKYRSGPVFYEFHQDPNFLYLTGMLAKNYTKRQKQG